MQNETIHDNKSAAGESTTPREVVPTLARAESLVRKNVYICAAVGLVPIPLFDMVAVSSLQVNMLYRLCKLYDIPFSQEAAKSVVASLLAGGGAAALGKSASVSLAKSIPFIGTVIGGMAMPVLAGASTYAVGKVFITHFESGGTFLTFNPERVKAYFAQLQQEGKGVVAEVLGTN
jgi:uncharacterized protein (DUF697 family)